MLRETVSVQTLDGISLEADLIRSDAAEVRATVVIGHPHPLYGGDRHNHVVSAIQEAAALLQCDSLAIDFRGVGNSQGVHDDGDAERLDLAAACEFADFINSDAPIIVAGYSFGAAVALNVTHPLVTGWLAVAPPAAMIASRPTSSQHHRRKVIIHPEHDQFCSAEALAGIIASWENTQTLTLSAVDHFIAFGARDACHQALSVLLDS